jgi:hypothetical protein
MRRIPVPLLIVAAVLALFAACWAANLANKMLLRPCDLTPGDPPPAAGDVM